MKKQLKEHPKMECVVYKLSGEVIPGGTVVDIPNTHPWTALHNIFFIDNIMGNRFQPGDVIALPTKENLACRLVEAAPHAKYPSTDDGYIIDGVFEPKFFGKRSKQ